MNGLDPGTFFQIPRSAWEALRSGDASMLRVFVELCSKANRNGESFPTIETLAGELGVHRASVFRALERLETAGWIERDSGRGRHHQNVYRISIGKGRTHATLSNGKGRTHATQNVAPMRLKGRTHATQNETQERNPKNETHKVSSETHLPDVLDTPDFRHAYTDYREYRRERKLKLTPRGETALLKRLAKWGATRAVAAIEYSMAQGWHGVFEEKTNGQHHTAKPPAPAYRDLSAIASGKEIPR